jgi:hypothetical protein
MIEVNDGERVSALVQEINVLRAQPWKEWVGKDGCTVEVTMYRLIADHRLAQRCNW